MTNQAIGQVKWYGGYNRKTNKVNDFGYIECLDHDIDQDLRVSKNQLRCDESQLTKGRLVEFELGINQSSRKFVKNLHPLKEVGLIQWYNLGEFGVINRFLPHRTIDGKSEVFIHSNQVLCSEMQLTEGTPVVFEVQRNYIKQRDEALNLYLLTEEYDIRIIELCVHSEYPDLWFPTLKKYVISLSLSPDKALEICAEKLEKLSWHHSKDAFILSFPKNILLEPQAKSIRTKLSPEKNINLLIERISEQQYEGTVKKKLEEELIETLSTAKKVDNELIKEIRNLNLRSSQIEKAIDSLFIRKYGINYLYHMTHIDNLESIFKYGLLSHNEAHRRGLVKVDISMQAAQEWRKKVHNYVPFYFSPRNTMLYKRDRKSVV